MRAKNLHIYVEYNISMLDYKDQASHQLGFPPNQQISKILPENLDVLFLRVVE